MNRNPNTHARRGQSLAEALIAIFVGMLMVVAAVGVITPVITGSVSITKRQAAEGLGRELLEYVKTLGEADWHALRDITGGVHHYVSTSLVPPLVPGEEQITLSDVMYTRYFYVETVNRDASGNITGGLCCEDPSTFKVTVEYYWDDPATKQFITRYLLRARNRAAFQTDWSGGGGLTVSVKSFDNRFAAQSGIDFASTTGSLIIGGF